MFIISLLVAICDSFPGFACWGDFILGYFKNQFLDCSSQPEKNRIRIAVQYQDACIVAGRRLFSIDKYKNKLYVKTIGDLYFVLYVRIRCNGT